MNESADIAELRQVLKRSLLSAPLTTLSPSENEAVCHLTLLRQRLGGPLGHRSLARIGQGVMAFRLLGRKTPYPELKYACYGIARPTDWEGRLLLDDEKLCDELLSAVAALEFQRPWIHRACCQGLLAAWQDDIAPRYETFANPARHNAVRVESFLKSGYR